MLKSIQEAVLKKTSTAEKLQIECSNIIDDTGDNNILLQHKVCGYDFNKGINHSALLQTYLTTGFQATNFALSIKQIESMLNARQEPFEPDEYEDDPFIRRQTGCTIFLGYTSNIISSGIRESIRFLVQHRMVTYSNHKLTIIDFFISY